MSNNYQVLPSSVGHLVCEKNIKKNRWKNPFHDFIQLKGIPSGKRLHDYGKIHHFVAGKIHYVYGPCFIANCKRWPIRNTSSTRPETRWQWHHWDVLGTFSPSGGPVAPCPAGGWDTIGYPLEPPTPTPVLRDSAERTCSTSSVLVAFECPTGQPYPDGPGKLRKHMNKCYISGEVVEKCQHSMIFNVSMLIIWRVYDGLWEVGFHSERDPSLKSTSWAILTATNHLNTTYPLISKHTCGKSPVFKAKSSINGDVSMLTHRVTLRHFDTSIVFPGDFSDADPSPSLGWWSPPFGCPGFRDFAKKCAWRRVLEVLGAVSWGKAMSCPVP